MNLVDHLREQEKALGPAKVEEAMLLVMSWGWPRGSNPPPYVWAEAYRQVAARGRDNAGTPVGTP